MSVTALDPFTPEVGMLVWSRTHYRTICEILEPTQKDVWIVRAYDERDEQLHRMTLTITRPGTAHGSSVERAKIQRPQMTPELRQKIEDGLSCRARGHDLTGVLPSGRAAIYLAPNGQRACRWCKIEAAERRKEKVEKQTANV